MATKPTLTSRPYSGEADLPAIARLINQVSKTHNLDFSTSVEGLSQWFSFPDMDAENNVRLWDDSGSKLVAVAIFVALPVTEESADGRLIVRIHPDYTDRGLDSELIEWAAGRLRESAAGASVPSYLMTGEVDTFKSQLEALERNGFTFARYFFVMHRPLDEPISEPNFPDGFTLSNVGEHPDVGRYVEMFNLSFIDHWSFHPMQPERRAHRLTDPQYKHEGGLIVIAPDGTFAAFADCYIDTRNNEREGKSEGWIHILGTRRGYRGIGLGRAILLAALRWIKSQGVSTAVLDVDAENPTGALRLYESAGFSTVKTEVVYRKEV